MKDGTAFALVAKPCLLALAPGTPAVNEVENGSFVFLVEFFDFGETGIDHLLVPRGVGLTIGGSIANQRIVKILPIGAAESIAPISSVDIRQIVYFQLLQQFNSFLLVLQDGGHNNHCGIFLGNHSIFELQFECSHRLVQPIQQLVEQVYHHLAHRHSHEDRQQQHQPPQAAHVFFFVAFYRQMSKTTGQYKRYCHHNPDIPPCPGVPALRWEKSPTHMLTLFVGFCH